MKLLATGICLFVIGLTVASATKTDPSKWTGLVSKYMKNNLSLYYLQVTTAAGSDITIGSNVKWSELKKPPKVCFKEGKTNQPYTLFVIAISKSKEYIAWMGMDGEAADLRKSDVIVPYWFRMPEKGSEPLLCIVLVYKQEKKYNSEAMSMYLDVIRKSKHPITGKLIDKPFGKPDGGFWFNVHFN